MCVCARMCFCCAGNRCLSDRLGAKAELCVQHLQLLHLHKEPQQIRCGSVIFSAPFHLNHSINDFSLCLSSRHKSELSFIHSLFVSVVIGTHFFLTSPPAWVNGNPLYPLPSAQAKAIPWLLPKQSINDGH